MDSEENDSTNEYTSKPERMAQFLELYSKHSSKLQYYLMALIPASHDAGDVLQETSLVLWKKFDQFEIGSNFMAWACKIARLQAMKHHQRSNKSAKLFDVTVLEKLAVDAEPSVTQQTTSLEKLEYCMSKLSKVDQTLIQRRYEYGSSVKRIASDIGRTANSVSKSLGRIRQALLQCMKQQIAANT